MGTDHEEEEAREQRPEDLHIPEGPITRAKARALQEAVRSCMITPYAEQGVSKVLHVATFAWQPGVEATVTKEARP